MKKLIALFVAVACVSMTQASELWWFVADTVTIDGKSVAWDTAQLFANGQDGSVLNGTPILSGTVSHADMQDFSLAMSTIEDSYTSFYVELYNNDQLVGISDNGTHWYGTSRSEIAAQGGIYDGSVISPTASPYEFNAFMIPEPTSGLLVMLGMMMLGLKRKRV